MLLDCSSPGSSEYCVLAPGRQRNSSDPSAGANSPKACVSSSLDGARRRQVALIRQNRKRRRLIRRRGSRPSLKNTNRRPSASRIGC